MIQRIWIRNTCVVDPDPHYFENLDPHPDPEPHSYPHQRDKLDPEPDPDTHKFADGKPNVWNMSLFEHFFKGFEHFES
jgi:hypothetical protein